MHCYNQYKEMRGREIPLEMRSGEGGEMGRSSWKGFGPSADGEDTQHQRRNNKSRISARKFEGNK